MTTTPISYSCNLSDLRDQIAPLYRKYDGQLMPQPAYISIDVATGKIDADYSGEIGGAVPARVWHGIERRHAINPFAEGIALAAFLQTEPFTVLAQRIVDGSDEEWDGSNWIGTLNDDAAAAEEELAALIASEFHPAGNNTATVWDEDYLDCCELTDHWPAGMTLEEAAKRLDEEARSERAYLDVDPAEYLLSEAAGHLNVDALREKLYECHIAALLADDRIDDEDAQEWRDTYGIEFQPLGYGSREEAIQRLLPGKWVLILDNAAAEAGADSCWIAAQGDPVRVRTQYRADGGTASEVHEIIKQ